MEHRPTRFVGTRILLMLAVIAAPVLALSALPADSGKDAREVRRLQREIQQGMPNAEVSDEVLAGNVRALARHASRDVVRFLVEQVLSPIPRIETEHDVDRDELIPVVIEELWRIADEHEALREIVDRWLDRLMFEEELMLIDDNLEIIGLHFEHRPDRITPEFFRKGLAAEPWSVRVTLSHRLANTGTEPLNEASLRELLANRWDTDYRVRSATVAVFERMLLDEPAGRTERKLLAYNALIELLAREQSGLRYKIAEILQALTGRGIPDDADQWRAWLNAFRAGDTEENPDAPVVSDMGRNSLFGIQVPRKNVFVIDVSSSMHRPLVNRDAIRRRIEVDGPRSGYDWEAIETRLDLARAELIHIINSLQEPDPRARRPQQRRPATSRSRVPDGQPVGDATESFTIIAYSTRVVYWRERVVPATRENKDAAIHWLKRLRTEALTNIYDAIDTALHMASYTPFPDTAVPAEPESGADGDKHASRHAKHPPEGFTERLDARGVVESVIFLSDGFATTGKYWANGEFTFPAVDSDGDGRVSFDELKARFDLEYIDEQRIRELFEFLDADGSGAISREEFEARLAHYYELQMDNMIQELSVRNVLDQVRLHCIGIGNHDRRTLRLLAEFNDGVYVDLGE